MKVLLVEDDKKVVKGITRHCEQKGWKNKVVEFKDAFTSVVEFDPDIIVMDSFRICHNFP